MTNKEEQLVSKGYDKVTVLEVCRYSEEELEEAVSNAISVLSNNVNSVSNPKCIYVGGQPGVGKSVLCDKLKRSSNSVELSMDACRMYHPNYERIESVIKDYYKDKEITDSNNPGNDIASFTQDFAGNMANMLIDRISDMKYNIIIEWNMRKSSDVLSCMEKLSKKGYKNEAIVVVVNKETSLEACKVRADIMNNNGHIVRRVSNFFHEICLDTIPSNVDTIYQVGMGKDILDDMKVVLRNGNVIWDNDESITLPSITLNKYYNDIELTKDFKNNYKWAEISYDKESVGLNIEEILNKEDVKKLCA